MGLNQAFLIDKQLLESGTKAVYYFIFESFHILIRMQSEGSLKLRLLGVVTHEKYMIR